MFLYIISVGASNRLAQEHYSRSGDTVSYCFHQVLDALNILHEHISCQMGLDQVIMHVVE